MLASVLLLNVHTHVYRMWAELNPLEGRKESGGHRDPVADSATEQTGKVCWWKKVPGREVAVEFIIQSRTLINITPGHQEEYTGDGLGERGDGDPISGRTAERRLGADPGAPEAPPSLLRAVAAGHAAAV